MVKPKTDNANWLFCPKSGKIVLWKKKEMDGFFHYSCNSWNGKKCQHYCQIINLKKRQDNPKTTISKNNSIVLRRQTMGRERIVIVYIGDMDDVYAEYLVNAVSDWQAIHIVAEHHPEIMTMDFDVMTKGLDL